MEGENSLKDRIHEFIHVLGMSVRKFSLTIGVSESYVRNMKNNIGSDKLRNILRLFPQINLYWLIDGQGEMFLDNSVNNSVGNDNDISGNSLLGSGSIDSSININTSEGYSKIIKPDRTIEIQASELDEFESQLAIYKNKISDMQKTIDSQKETIEAQKLVINLLQKKK